MFISDYVCLFVSRGLIRVKKKFIYTPQPQEGDAAYLTTQNVTVFVKTCNPMCNPYVLDRKVPSGCIGHRFYSV